MQLDKKDFEDWSRTPVAYRGTGAAKGFVESFSDAWDYQRFTGNSSSKQNNFHDEYEKYIEEVKEATGEELNNPYNSGWEEFLLDHAKYAGHMLVSFPNAADKNSPFRSENIERQQQLKVSEFYKKVDKLRRFYPEMPYKTFEDIQENIRKQARILADTLNDGKARNLWGDFAGTAAGSMTDPINITASLLSGGFAGTAQTGLATAIGRAALVEGTVNMASEAAIQGDVYRYKQELGEEYTAENALYNVLGAGVGGAVLGGAAVASNRMLRGTLAKFKEYKSRGFKFRPGEEDLAILAEQRLELDDYLQATNPFGDTETGFDLHKAAFLTEQRRLLDEQQAMSAAYDKVLANPVGDPDEVLLSIKPEDLEGVDITRGEYKPVTGTSRSGYGMVKFIFKHGEKGNDAIKLTKEDVLAFPKIIREYEPITTEAYGQNYRIWSVQRGDGYQVQYIDKQFSADSPRRAVSMLVVQPNRTKGREWDNIFSPKKNLPVSQPAVQAPVKDTAPGSYYRPPESGRIENNITPSTEKVKIESESVYPKVDEIEKILAEQDELLPLREVDGGLETISAREHLQTIKKQEADSLEIINCIKEFGKWM